jgi:hypothetical protein
MINKEVQYEPYWVRIRSDCPGIRSRIVMDREATNICPSMVSKSHPSAARARTYQWYPDIYPHQGRTPVFSVTDARYHPDGSDSKPMERKGLLLEQVGERLPVFLEPGPGAGVL